MNKHDEAERAKHTALLCLGRRALTEKQLSGKLSEKGFSGEAIGEAVAYLLEIGYLDDGEFARRYAQDALQIKGHSKRRILRSLAEKGIDPQTAREALEALEMDDSAALRRQMEEKIAGGTDLSDRRQKNRLAAYFARRGFGYSDIFSCMDALGNETDEFSE